MNDDTQQRKAFEGWISASPYEREVLRYPQDETKFAHSSQLPEACCVPSFQRVVRPGQYRSTHVQIAWEAWQESAATTIERFLKGLANKQ